MDNFKCNKCICKTCLIAYEHGAAEGCGNCLLCLVNDGPHINTCEDYINVNREDKVTINVSRRRESLIQLYDFFKELSKLDDKYVFEFDEENDRIYLTERKNVKEEN